MFGHHFLEHSDTARFENEWKINGWKQDARSFLFTSWIFSIACKAGLMYRLAVWAYTSLLRGLCLFSPSSGSKYFINWSSQIFLKLIDLFFWFILRKQ